MTAARAATNKHKTVHRSNNVTMCADNDARMVYPAPVVREYDLFLDRHAPQSRVSSANDNAETQARRSGDMLVNVAHIDIQTKTVC